jgi:hypothetical protein
MTGKAGFIPHPECMVASGDCFRLSKCLGGCRDRAFYQHQVDIKALRQEIAKLEIRILKLEPPNAK